MDHAGRRQACHRTGRTRREKSGSKASALCPPALCARAGDARRVEDPDDTRLLRGGAASVSAGSEHCRPFPVAGQPDGGGAGGRGAPRNGRAGCRGCAAGTRRSVCKRVGLWRRKRSRIVAWRDHRAARCVAPLHRSGGRGRYAFSPALCRIRICRRGNAGHLGRNHLARSLLQSVPGQRDRQPGNGCRQVDCGDILGRSFRRLRAC